MSINLQLPESKHVPDDINVSCRATHLLQDGMDITSVQRVLGHNDLESTQRYLGVQRTEVLQAQVEQMASRF